MRECTESPKRMEHPFRRLEVLLTDVVCATVFLADDRKRQMEEKDTIRKAAMHKQRQELLVCFACAAAAVYSLASPCGVIGRQQLIDVLKCHVIFAKRAPQT